jgi:hypothetical protein
MRYYLDTNTIISDKIQLFPVTQSLNSMKNRDWSWCLIQGVRIALGTNYHVIFTLIIL